MSAMLRPACVALLSLALGSAAFADGTAVKRVHHSHHHYRLPAGRHVVEKVSPPGSGLYLLNGAWFAAHTPRCAGWVAGDRIRLLRGEWHGYCGTAVFRNVSRRMTCELSCGRW
jgi:hypothetical protein